MMIEILKTLPSVVWSLSDSLSHWQLLGVLCGITMLGGWAYFRILNVIPQVNFAVLLVGLAMLIVGYEGNNTPISLPVLDSSDGALSTAIVWGLLLLGLAAAGTWQIRRDLARESLRRRIWDRIASQDQLSNARLVEE